MQFSPHFSSSCDLATPVSTVTVSSSLCNFLSQWIPEFWNSGENCIVLLGQGAAKVAKPSPSSVCCSLWTGRETRPQQRWAKMGITRLFGERNSFLEEPNQTYSPFKHGKEAAGRSIPLLFSRPWRPFLRDQATYGLQPRWILLNLRTTSRLWRWRK